MKSKTDIHPEWTSPIVAAAIEVHRALGPGLLESAYQSCLAHELRLRGIAFEQQVPVPLIYKGLELEAGYRLDFWIEGRLVVEVKAVLAILPIHGSQLLTYLRLLKAPLGLLINFNVELVAVEGMKRVLNHHALAVEERR